MTGWEEGKLQRKIGKEKTCRLERREKRLAASELPYLPSFSLLATIPLWNYNNKSGVRTIFQSTTGGTP